MKHDDLGFKLASTTMTTAKALDYRFIDPATKPSIHSLQSFPGPDTTLAACCSMPPATELKPVPTAPTIRVPLISASTAPATISHGEPGTPDRPPAAPIIPALSVSSSLSTSTPVLRAHTTGGAVLAYSLCSLSTVDIILWFSKYRSRAYGTSVVREPGSLTSVLARKF